jgi:hypothetical protein
MLGNIGKNASLAAALLIPTLLAGFQSDAQSPNLAPQGQQLNIGGAGYVPPKGWSVRQSGDAAVMIGPRPQGYQPCMIVINPTVRPSLSFLLVNLSQHARISAP